MLSPKAERVRPASLSSTRWSVILSAKQPNDPQSHEALAGLYQKYWPPLYWYARRRGSSVEESQDLCQEFFTRLLEKNYLDHVHQERGKFRSFLLASFKHFLSNERDVARAQKRGGAASLLSLDEKAGERGSPLDAPHSITPEMLFERQWALALLENVLVRLREEYRAAGKEPLFEGLKTALTGERGKTPYREIAAGLGLSEGAVKVAVHRLRRRYREALREEIAETVAETEDVDAEIRYLFSVLAS